MDSSPDQSFSKNIILVDSRICMFDGRNFESVLVSSLEAGSMMSFQSLPLCAVARRPLATSMEKNLFSLPTTGQSLPVQLGRVSSG